MNRRILTKWIAPSLAVAMLTGPAWAGRAPIAERKASPYTGCIAVDVATGDVLFEDQPDAMAYPASMIKMMVLLVVLETIDAGQLALTDEVVTSAAASKMGGSQVYLAEHERFTIDELLYALMIQSANDAALALAERVAGSRDAFVEKMNERASSLGMRRTRFHSVHGLPPAEGQSPDITSARDMSKLAIELVARPEALVYTSTPVRGFRNDTFEMRTHNRLLGTFPGCDGLKTGYFRAGGFSLTATAERGGTRVVAVLLGCETKQERDAKAREILEQAFRTAGSR